MMYGFGNPNICTSKNDHNIVERMKKRLEECKTNSNGISMKDDWGEYKFQIRLVPELQKLIEGEK